MQKKLWNTFISVFFILLISLTLIQLGSRVFHASVDFDEGYNLQIALNLNKSLKYSTFDNVHDVNITTGPTVLIPAAFLYSTTNPLFPRIIMVSYALLFLAILFTKYFQNNTEKVIYLLLINTVPLYFLFSTQILGELPGFVFILLSYLAFSKSKYFLAGTFFMLGVITKSAYIIGVAPYVFLTLYSYFQSRKFYFNLKSVVAFILPVVLLVVVWELFKYSQFDFNFANYLLNLNNAIALTEEKGGALRYEINNRLDMIGYTLFIRGLFFAFITMFVSAYVFVKNQRAEIKLLSLFTMVYFLQFIFLGSTSWYRHMFPSIMSLLLIIPYFLNTFFTSINFEKKLFIFSAVIAAVIILVGYSYKDQNDIFYKRLIKQNLLFLDQSNKPYLKEKTILKDQRDVANFIKNNTKPSDRIAGFPWINSPEISYLSGRKIYRTPENKKMKYIIFSLYNKYLDPDANIFIENSSLQKVYENKSYQIYSKSL